jgi:hypothetical protein
VPRELLEQGGGSSRPYSMTAVLTHDEELGDVAWFADEHKSEACPGAPADQ